MSVVTASYLSSRVHHQVVPQSLHSSKFKGEEVVQGTSVLPAMSCHSEVRV
jgi:hypothetical protein